MLPPDAGSIRFRDAVGVSEIQLFRYQLIGAGFTYELSIKACAASGLPMMPILAKTQICVGPSRWEPPGTAKRGN